MEDKSNGAQHDVPQPSTHQKTLIPQSYVSGPMHEEPAPPKPLFTRRRMSIVVLLIVCASIITYAVALASN